MSQSTCMNSLSIILQLSTVIKHQKLFSSRPCTIIHIFVIRNLTFACFHLRAFFHLHFNIRILPSAFFHSHFIIQFFPSAIRHPSPSATNRYSVYRDPLPFCWFIAELRPLSGASYRKEKVTHESIYCYHGERYCSWARAHDGDGDAPHSGHTPNNRFTETCSLGLPCTSLILAIHVMTN